MLSMLYQSYFKVKVRLDKNIILHKYHMMFHRYVCPYLELTWYRVCRKV